MKLIDRFVGRELIVNVLFAIAVLSLVLVVGNIFRKLLPLLVNHDVPLEFLLTFIAYVLPFSLIFTIPWGLLTAILLVFGRLSADNELIALRANGVSVTRVCVPLAFLAIVCTGICLWLNVSVAPAAQERLRSSIFDLATQNPIALFGGDQVIDQFPGRKIYVGKKEGNKLENITVFQVDEHDLPVRVTHARTGMLETDLPNKRLLLHLYDARYQERDPKDPFDLMKIRDGISLKEGTLPISLEELYEKEKKRPSRSALSLSQLLDQLKSGPRRERSATRTELNKRFSFPFSCIAFALIGVPLGITTHRRETSVGFATGLIVAIVYFLFIIIADTMRANPKIHPELLVWFPNVLFIALGGWLFYRLSKR
ncbi:MAG TPA: LptF/LptG family permease [Chthoniobacterales bacterium]|jgi:lipopolysaccharide export system permease protein|nr:LptF/LptG family permease [Chthoniobacterales bacterium]